MPSTGGRRDVLPALLAGEASSTGHDLQDLALPPAGDIVPAGDPEEAAPGRRKLAMEDTDRALDERVGAYDLDPVFLGHAPGADGSHEAIGVRIRSRTAETSLEPPGS